MEASAQIPRRNFLISGAALLGAGALGLPTRVLAEAFTFRLHQVGQVTIFNLTWPAKNQVELLLALQKIQTAKTSTSCAASSRNTIPRISSVSPRAFRSRTIRAAASPPSAERVRLQCARGRGRRRPNEERA